MTRAWNATTGDPDVVVAVLDTGLLSHPVPSEVAGRVLQGWDFVDNDADPHDEDPAVHGSLVTVVGMAKGNNGAQWAGICWSCSILPIRVLDADGAGTDTDIAAGIDFAVASGADVINLSLAGCGSPPPLAFDPLGQAVANALAAGVLIVAAAGNDLPCSMTSPRWPAAYEGVIGVAATATGSDARASYSGYGSWVDVAAPGTNLEDPGAGFAFVGTSSAAPVVAGLLGLALSLPNANPAWAVQRLLATSKPVAYVEHGRVDGAEFLGHHVEGIPVTGDWDGDGIDTGGWYVKGTWILLGAHDESPPIAIFEYGTPGAIPLVGDWDGDGDDDIGVRIGKVWYLRNQASAGPPTDAFGFGAATDVPIVGNWDGVPGDEIGIRRGKTFRLKFGLGGGTADVIFGFGLPDDVAIVGDFDANGVDDVGVVRDNTWRLKFAFAGGTADIKFHFARPNETDTPIAGDWNGDGVDTVGVTRDDTPASDEPVATVASWRLKNVHAGGKADIKYVNSP